MVRSPHVRIFLVDVQLTRNRWHIFTALGGYIGVAVVDLITSGEVDQDPIGLFAWPVPFAAGLLSEFSTSKKQA